MTRHFGLHPWDLERLTWLEIRWYRDALADMARVAQAQKNQQQARTATPVRRPPRRRR